MSWISLHNAFQSSQNKFKNILELKFTDETKANEGRKGIIDSRFAKFRASCLQVLRIYDTEKELFVDNIDHKCVYFISSWRNSI